MVRVLFVLAFLVCSAAGPVSAAQGERLELVGQSAGMRLLLMSEMIGDRVTLALDGGEEVSGTISEVTRRRVTLVLDGDGGGRTLRLKFVVAVTRILPPPPEPAPKAPAEPAPVELAAEPEAPDPSYVFVEDDSEVGQRKRVVLSKGSVYEGRLLQRTPQTIKLALGDGALVEIALAQVTAIEDISGVKGDAGGEEASADDAPVTSVSEARKRDPNRTRYLFAPSAMMLEKGEAYISQKELLLSEMGYGVTDYMSLVVGGVVPAWITIVGFNVALGVKVGFPLTDYLHWCVGAYGLIFPGPLLFDGPLVGGGFLFTTATLGSPDLHVSASVGTPFIVVGEDSLLGYAVVVLSGNWRMTDNLGLITENWLFPSALESDPQVGIINSLALRWMSSSGSFAVDIGAFFMPGAFQEGVFPILPWLDFTYNFEM